jgi:site-specific DNA-methyltransferase (adenine-specific)
VNQVIQGDCLEVMKTMPDNSVDLILSDPPYHRVKKEVWDNQWKNDDAFLEWIDQIAEQWARLLKPNGSLYCFASPKMSARVEVTIGRRFNVLTRIHWAKPCPFSTINKGASNSGRISKESLRSYYPNSESIIFAEHFGADNSAKGEAGYEQKSGELRGFVFEPLRAYLDGERVKIGVSSIPFDNILGTNGLCKKYFNACQWQLPTEFGYKVFQQSFPGYFLRPYESLRQEYELLRQEYESLRRPFNVTAQVPYTDTVTYPTVQAYKGKHVCEKPEKMLEDFISASSNPGAIVLDSFAGSGSTLIAAQKLGRQFIGIELDPHWVGKINHALNLRPEPTLEQRVEWLETKVSTIDKRTRKTAETIGQLSLFDRAS